MLRRAWLSPVRFYQRVISPLTPPSCRYVPSCSQYAIDAVQGRGIVVGTALAVWRILRCNPLFRGGHDPVPLKQPAAGQLAGAASCGEPGHAHEQRGCS